MSPRLSPSERWQAYNAAQRLPDEERCNVILPGLQSRCALPLGHSEEHRMQLITGMAFIPEDWEPE